MVRTWLPVSRLGLAVPEPADGVIRGPRLRRARGPSAPPEAYLEWSDTSPVPLSTVAEELGVITPSEQLDEAAGELAAVGPEQTDRVGTPLFFRERWPEQAANVHVRVQLPPK